MTGAPAAPFFPPLRRVIQAIGWLLIGFGVLGMSSVIMLAIDPCLAMSEYDDSWSHPTDPLTNVSVVVIGFAISSVFYTIPIALGWFMVRKPVK